MDSGNSRRAIIDTFETLYRTTIRCSFFLRTHKPFKYTIYRAIKKSFYKYQNQNRNALFFLSAKEFNKKSTKKTYGKFSNIFKLNSLLLYNPMSQRKKNHRRNIIFKLNGHKNTTYLNMWVTVKQKCLDGN